MASESVPISPPPSTTIQPRPSSHHILPFILQYFPNAVPIWAFLQQYNIQSIADVHAFLTTLLHDPAPFDFDLLCTAFSAFNFIHLNNVFRSSTPFQTNLSLHWFLDLVSSELLCLLNVRPTRNSANDFSTPRSLCGFIVNYISLVYLQPLTSQPLVTEISPNSSASNLSSSSSHDLSIDPTAALTRTALSSYHSITILFWYWQLRFFPDNLIFPLIPQHIVRVLSMLKIEPHFPAKPFLPIPHLDESSLLAQPLEFFTHLPNPPLPLPEPFTATISALSTLWNHQCDYIAEVAEIVHQHCAVTLSTAYVPNQVWPLVCPDYTLPFPASNPTTRSRPVANPDDFQPYPPDVSSNLDSYLVHNVRCSVEDMITKFTFHLSSTTSLSYHCASLVELGRPIPWFPSHLVKSPTSPSTSSATSSSQQPQLSLSTWSYPPALLFEHFPLSRILFVHWIISRALEVRPEHLNPFQNLINAAHWTMFSSLPSIYIKTPSSSIIATCPSSLGQSTPFGRHLSPLWTSWFPMSGLRSMQMISPQGSRRNRLELQLRNRFTALSQTLYLQAKANCIKLGQQTHLPASPPNDNNTLPTPNNSPMTSDITLIEQLLQQTSITAGKHSVFQMALIFLTVLVERISGGVWTLSAYGSAMAGLAGTNSDIDVAIVPGNPTMSLFGPSCWPERQAISPQSHFDPFQWNLIDSGASPPPIPDNDNMFIDYDSNPAYAVSKASVLYILTRYITSAHNIKVGKTIESMAKFPPNSQKNATCVEAQSLVCSTSSLFQDQIEIVSSPLLLPTDDPLFDVERFNQQLSPPDALAENQSAATQDDESATAILMQYIRRICDRSQPLPVQFSDVQCTSYLLGVRISLISLILPGNQASDISASSPAQLITNTRFLRSCGATYPLVLPMIRVLKHWAQIRGAHGAAAGNLNSFALGLMLINFLQAKGLVPIVGTINDSTPSMFDPQPKHGSQELFISQFWPAWSQSNLINYDLFFSPQENPHLMPQDVFSNSPELISHESHSQLAAVNKSDKESSSRHQYSTTLIPIAWDPSLSPTYRSVYQDSIQSGVISKPFSNDRALSTSNKKTPTSLLPELPPASTFQSQLAAIAIHHAHCAVDCSLLLTQTLCFALPPNLVCKPHLSILKCIPQPPLALPTPLLTPQRSPIHFSTVAALPAPESKSFLLSSLSPSLPPSSFVPFWSSEYNQSNVSYQNVTSASSEQPLVFPPTLHNIFSAIESNYPQYTLPIPSEINLWSQSTSWWIPPTSANQRLYSIPLHNLSTILPPLHPPAPSTPLATHAPSEVSQTSSSLTTANLPHSNDLNILVEPGLVAHPQKLMALPWRMLSQQAQRDEFESIGSYHICLGYGGIAELYQAQLCGALQTSQSEMSSSSSSSVAPTGSHFHSIPSVNHISFTGFKSDACSALYSLLLSLVSNQDLNESSSSNSQLALSYLVQRCCVPHVSFPSKDQFPTLIRLLREFFLFQAFVWNPFQHSIVPSHGYFIRNVETARALHSIVLQNSNDSTSEEQLDSEHPLDSQLDSQHHIASGPRNDLLVRPQLCMTNIVVCDPYLPLDNTSRSISSTAGQIAFEFRQAGIQLLTHQGSLQNIFINHQDETTNISQIIEDLLAKHAVYDSEEFLQSLFVSGGIKKHSATDLEPSFPIENDLELNDINLNISWLLRIAALFTIRKMLETR